MGMMLEEAIALFEKQLTAAQVVLDSGFGSNPGENNSLYRRRKEMAEIALSALRSVSRERVEKMKSPWKSYFNGDYNDEIYYCEECGHKLESYSKLPNFCPDCGVPKTDEAVEMVMERMEALHDTEN